MLRNLNRVFFGLSLACCLIANSAFAGETTTKRTKRATAPVEIKISAWGPKQALIDAAKLRVERSAEVQSLLKGTKYRLIEVNYVENEDKTMATKAPTRFNAVFYDYTNDRVIVAQGDFAGKGAITVREEFYQPIPNEEEFLEAVSILQSDKRFGRLLRGNALKTFRPMPPTTVLGGTAERLVNVGLQGNGASGQNEIVSVSIKRGEAIRYNENAPPTALASPDACGVAEGGNAGSGGSGQYQMSVMQNGSPLWEMLIISPTVSSGTSGSGIEIRDVKYKGKSVLKRGHAPVLNVQYTANACGPYRDWQDELGSFNAPAAGATNPAAGIRVLASGQVATTILENGTDAGNFKGTAIYTQDVGFGNEIVMVSELDAGWYRYIMEWRFADDGTIRPRFGFGATNSSCVCNVHNHHVYWRLDFDIVNSVNKVFQVERGRKFLKPIATETRMNKNLQSRRSLLVQNSTGDEAYMLVPNMSDGLVDTFAVNDFWVLRYKTTTGNPVQSEIDDGRSCCSSLAEININNWVNNESLVDQDAVVWYGAHFIHSESGSSLMNPDRSGLVISGSHVVGPDIRPVRW